MQWRGRCCRHRPERGRFSPSRNRGCTSGFPAYLVKRNRIIGAGLDTGAPAGDASSRLLNDRISCKALLHLLEVLQPLPRRETRHGSPAGRVDLLFLRVSDGPPLHLSIESKSWPSRYRRWRPPLVSRPQWPRSRFEALSLRLLLQRYPDRRSGASEDQPSWFPWGQVQPHPGVRQAQSASCPRAVITASTSIVNSEPGTATGLRRPLSSGSVKPS